MSTHCGICFGLGHSEKNCGSKPASRPPDSDNPLHHIGYGRGDDVASRPPPPPRPRMTQAYSFINPDKIVNVGDDTVDPTIPMHTVENLTVKDLVHRLIERNLQAWKALPEKIRDAMMERPQEFQLIPTKLPKEGDFDYSILYNGTIWRYHPTQLSWNIFDIVR